MATRVLITRLSHIGDCVLTLPLANYLKSSVPDIEISWAVESPSDQLLRLNRNVDEIIKIPKAWMKRPKDWFQVRKLLRQKKFDISIDPQGITKSAILGWLSGAPQRFGVQGRWGRELSPWLNNRLTTTESSHVVDRTLDLGEFVASSLGAVATVATRNRSANELFQMEPDSESFRSVMNFLADQKLAKFVVVNPGASWASKRWELDRFASVIKELKTRYRLTSIVTWAGDEEKEMADQILQTAPSAVLAPRTSLCELAALCQQAEFFIGCDTGPLHIAAAVGTPCIGLYGTTLPTESGAYGAHHLAIQERYHAGSCRERRSADNAAMREIQVETVLDRISYWIHSRSALNVA